MPTGGSTDVASKGVTSPRSKPKPPTDTKSDTAVTKTVGEKAMGSRWSGAADPGGKAPSTASGSSTHTASTVPVDSVEVKSSTLPARTSGVAGFLRRKPSGKTAAEASGRRVSDVAAAGGSAAEKPAKKGVGSALRSSLFKRKGKASPAAAAGEDRPADALAEKERPRSGRGSTSPPKAQQPASRGSQDSTEATARRKTPSPRARKAPSPAPRKSPSPTPHKAPSPAPAGHDNAGHDKGSTSSATAGVAGKKSPAGSDRPVQGLTPAAKEALKKHWFTDGQPSAAPEPVSRRTTRSMAEARSRPDRSGDAVGPPAKVSRVSEAVISLNAKSGGKAPPKPRPASPQKSTGAGKTTETGDMTDSMDSKSAFEAVNTGAVKAKHSTKSRTGAGTSKSPDSSVTKPKSDGKGASADGGLSGLMSAMDGFSPDGSKAGTRTTDENMEGTNTRDDVGKSEIDHANAKPDPSHKNGARHDQKSMEVEKSVPDQDKSLHMVSDDKTAARDDKKSTKSTLDGIESNIESKFSKTAAWRPGDDDGGELGLGGISRKNRQDRAERPSAPKSDIADLDFLSSVIQKSPKTPDPPKSPKASEKPTEKGKSQEKAVEEEKGLDDLMSLAKDFDISTLSKFEPVTAEVKPDVQSADMDEFLDFMSTEPAKPAAPPAPAAEEISEPSIAAAKTWRTGDDDDEKMTELKNKKRDHDAPSQAPEWDIDDLVTDVLSSKPKGQAAAGTDRQQDDGDKRPTNKGLSAFDDFLTGTLSEKASSADRDVGKPSPSTASAKTKGAVPRKVDDEGFDKLSSDSLDKSLPLLSSAASHEEHVDAPKKVSDVDSAPGSAIVDEEVTAVAAASHTTAKPGNKRKPVSDKHLEKHGDTRGSCPDHGHGVRDVLYDDKDKTGRKNSDSKSDEQHREPLALDDLIQPVKASSMSSAPQREEAVVALTAASAESAKKPTDKKATGKHIEKHGDTRGSCPDHGHGVRDILYDDKDKTGRKSSASKGASKPREPAVLDDLIHPVKVSSTSSAPHPVTGVDEAVVALTAAPTESAVKPADKKTTDKHIEKHGDTRGSCPDHGHGVRDILYDDKDKTGRKSSASKGASKPREPAVLDDLIQPVKVSSTSSAPHPVTGAEEAVVALTATSTESAVGPTDKKATDKHIEKHGDTRGSCPDHGHGVRDILYDDKDKTGRKSSASKGASKPREPAVLDDLIHPVKVSSTSSAPHPVTGVDEAVVALTAAPTESAVKKPADKKTTDKHIEKHGDTRGSCPDHGHGVRDILYDDKDKTGRKSSASKGASKPREPAVLDDLIQPVKVSSTSSAPHPVTGAEEAVVALTATSTESAVGPTDKKATDKHIEKHGDTRGSCPDHGHGVRDILYDDKDKTGRKSSASKGASKPREPAVLDDLIQPVKVSSTSSAPHPVTGAEEAVVALTATSTESAVGPTDNKTTDKHIEKHGDTRGSCPDHGHGVRDILYDDSDKTGTKKPTSKGSNGHREPAVLDDLIRPVKASSTSSSPQKEELVTAQTTVSVESVPKVSGRKATDKHVDKHGDTRGSCPDHGHGVRDVLYDDSDKTGRSEKGSAAKGDKRREPADLDNLIRPIHASTTSSAVPQQPPDNDQVTSSSAHTTAASPQLAKGKQTNSKHVDKEGNTRGSVPDHGHGLRDVLYDKSDKTGGGKMSESKDESKTREPADLHDLIVSTHASHTATQPSQQAAHHPPDANAPLVAAAASTTQTAPPAVAASADAPLGAAAASTTQTAPLAAAAATAAAPPPPHQAERDPPKKSVSLAGMTDPDDEDEDDGEELRRLIASTEALQEKLHAYVSHADSKQEQAVQEETSRELEQLERRLEQKERRLESAGRGRDVQAIKDGLRKVKQQLDTSRAGK